MEGPVGRGAGVPPRGRGQVGGHIPGSQRRDHGQVRPGVGEPRLARDHLLEEVADLLRTFAADGVTRAQIEAEALGRDVAAEVARVDRTMQHPGDLGGDLSLQSLGLGRRPGELGRPQHVVPPRVGQGEGDVQGVPVALDAAAE